MLKSFLLVFLGGGLGSVTRFIISKIDFFNAPNVMNTVIINVIGSFLIGLILGFALKSESSDSNYILFFTTGFCGGFTTFSAFTKESLELYQTFGVTNSFLYILVNVLLCLSATYLGYKIS